MNVLKTVGKREVKFLMDFDYNNILGRLKFILRSESSFFADVQIRKTDITWSTRSNLEYKPFCEASETEKQTVRKSLDAKKQKISKMIADDALIGNVVNQITTFPSEQYVYYAPLGNSYNIVIAGWGCSLMGNQCEENVKDHSNSPYSNFVSKPTHERSKETKPNHPKVTDGFFIGNEKTSQKKNTKRSKIEIIKSILLVLLAAFLALVIPIILTPFANRFVADTTHQWYLSGGTRVLITIFITFVTYSLAYLIIRFTLLRKSIIFNSICLILTLLWCVCAGILWIPD